MKRTNVIVAVVVLLLTAIGSYNMGKHHDFTSNEVDVIDTILVEDSNYQTRKLVTETLEKIGCQYEIDDDEDKAIRFAYQGEDFIILADDDSYFIGILDPWWYRCEMTKGNLFNVMEVINAANIKENHARACYGIDEEDNEIGVHTISRVLFTSDISDIDLYLRALLDEFFDMHRYVLNEIDKTEPANKTYSQPSVYEV